jgi:hypothetical protein
MKEYDGDKISPADVFHHIFKHGDRKKLKYAEVNKKKTGNDLNHIQKLLSP